MKAHHRFETGTTHLFRLEAGDDVVEEITRFVTEHRIEAAWIGYLGAVRKASLRYYDQDALEYIDFTIDEHLEVLSGMGNVSLLDGKPFVHTHAVFSDREGKAFGGHLNAGCEVWSLEVRIEELVGDAPVRQFDETTGLSLWRHDGA